MTISNESLVVAYTTGFNAGSDAERTRIVGLFDAAYKEWTEDKIENIYEEYQHIIEGLRK
jgi:hypothetical protein